MSSILGLDEAIRDPYQDVSIKVGPSKTLGTGTAGTTTTASGTEQPVASPATATQAPLGFGLNGMSVLPTDKRLTRNPQLASTPQNVQQDDLYAAQLAQARHTLTQQYLAMLRDIGFVDDNGNFLPGLIETEAARRRAALQKQMSLATDTVNNDALRGGAFFSGRRATNLANAQDPYARDLSNLETDVPRLLTDRYNDISGLLSGWTLTQDQLLAELAQRNADRAQAAPSGAINIPAPVTTPVPTYDPQLGAQVIRVPGAGRVVEM